MTDGYLRDAASQYRASNNFFRRNKTYL